MHIGVDLRFDIPLLRAVKRNVSIPVIASSGAGRPEHFINVKFFSSLLLLLQHQYLFSSLFVCFQHCISISKF